MIVGTAPVGDHKSLIAPLTAQDLFNQVHALIGIFAIDLVVRSHHGSGPGFVDRHLKTGQVDLPQSALVNDRIHRHAALLLRVDREVLDAGVNALALDSLHVGSRHSACQIRIL